MALIIAGERSGVGKTTVTLALLSYLSQKGHKIQSFKVGPDYIDPMFHTAVTGSPCRNLDPILTSESYVQSCFALHSQGVDYALVEGVMGLFDGVISPLPSASPLKKPGGDRHLPSSYSDFASTAHIARLLDLPVLLVIDCSRLSGSVAAIAHGYRSLDPRINIAGVILNRVGSDRHLELLKNALEPLDLTILGVLRRQDQIAIPDRHLGLVPTAELNQLTNLFKQLAYLGETCFDWEKLLPLLQGRRQREEGGEISDKILAEEDYLSSRSTTKEQIRIAIACDRAFNFYYPDNLDILRQLGAELIPWSPLEDKHLPEKIQGLYFGGGFPEIFAEQLADNTSASHSVQTAILSGIPTYAECGGLMYLCEKLVDFNEQAWQMVGILPTTAIMSKRLTLGYRQATALQNSFLLASGETFYGHEFHYSYLTCLPNQPLFKLQGYQPHSPVLSEGWQRSYLHASYIHLHFGEYPSIPQKILQFCHKTPND